MKKIGAILLVAGTCIGSGMIALPMVMAKLGLVPSITLMLLIWFIMYYTSLVNLELNLQTEKGMPLSELGRHFSGKTAELIGLISLKLLSYSLLAVFIYGGSSIVQEWLTTKTGIQYSFESIATWFTLISIVVLLLPLKLIDYINRILFISLLTVVIVLILALTASVEWSNLPLFSAHYSDWSTWMALIPAVFTSFGFQVIFHTLTNYCNKDTKMLRQAFLWGSFIPAIVYILWTSSILSVVYHDNPLFYNQMVEGNVEVGELIHVLSEISKWESLQLLIWFISLLAIATSVIGIGIGLVDSLKEKISNRAFASLLTMGPAYLAVIYIPNAFLSVLGFAGMILAIIAIVLPVYLFRRIKSTNFYFNELRADWLIQLSVFMAALVIVCGVYNLL